MAGRRTFFFEGLGVSAGIAIGPAWVLDSDSFGTESYDLLPADIDEEIENFHRAVDMAKVEVSELGRQVAERIDRQQAAIFDAHLMMLEDPQIVDSTIEKIRRKKKNAEAMLWDVTRDLGEQMKAIGDQYFSERNHDLYDVSRRVIKFLRQLSAAHKGDMPKEGCIIVANDLGPGETAQLSRDHALGFCTNEGGATSHAAILAKALSIPAVVGLEFITHYIRTGDRIILDGTEGKVILNPSAEQIKFYEGRKRELEELRAALGELRNIPAVTTDGTRITLMANIELPEELDNIVAQGAEGIGLYRTEYLYMHREHLPREEDHLREYKLVLDRMGDSPVIMRTLDLGGDKMPDQVLIMPEQNPFMGLRAIRLCMARPDIFRTQLRAMLIAAASRELSIMLPMISSLDEIRATRRIIDELQESLGRAGRKLPTRVLLGAMIEIPAAALQTRAICEEVDFLSIGTNDLVQYTLAVDRVNKAVAGLYRNCHPAVLRLIRMVTEDAAPTNTPVSVCGEMASDPKLAIILVGLGVRTLSMSSASIPTVKRAIRAISLADAREIALEVCAAATAEEADRIVETRLRPVFEKIQRTPLPVAQRPARDSDEAIVVPAAKGSA